MSWPDVKLIPQTNKQTNKQTRLVLVPVIGVENGSGPCLRGTQNEVGTGTVIPKTLKVGVVPPCMVLIMKEGP